MIFKMINEKMSLKLSVVMKRIPPKYSALQQLPRKKKKLTSE